MTLFFFLVFVFLNNEIAQFNSVTHQSQCFTEYRMQPGIVCIRYCI